MVDLWRCRTCHVLLGIDIKHNSNECNCVSCGVKYTIDEIDFISNEQMDNVRKLLAEKLPEDILEHLTYRWLSRDTLGIIIDEDEEHMQTHIDFDLYHYITEELSEITGMFVTLDFD